MLRGPVSTADMATQAKVDLAHRTRRLTKKKRSPNATAGDGRLERPAPGERKSNPASAGAASGDKRRRREDSFFDAPVYRGMSYNQLLKDLGLSSSPGKAEMAKLTPTQRARVHRAKVSRNATAGDGRLERPAPRYNVNAGGKADAMVQGDAGSDLGDLRTYTRKRSQINRQFFGARTHRGKPDGNA